MFTNDDGASCIAEFYKMDKGNYVDSNGIYWSHASKININTVTAIMG